MVLQGKALQLLWLEAKDLPDRLRWLNDPEVTRYFTNLGSVPLTMDDLERWYVEVNKKTHAEIHFSIYTIGGEHIGGAQLKGIDWRNRSAEMGIFVGAGDCRGKGLGTEATRMLLEYAFHTLNLHRIWLRVDTQNTGAIKCYQKCGFIEEGIFRHEVFRSGVYHNSIVMSILQPEYEELHSD